MSEAHTRRLRAGLAGALCAGALSAWAVVPKASDGSLDAREFFLPELYLSSSHAPLQDVLEQLPNKAAWERFSLRDAAGQDVHVFVDPRSGAATNVMGVFPLLPGNGTANRVSLQDVSRRVGRELAGVDARVVAEAAHAFVLEHKAVLGIDATQLGAVRAVQVTPELWHVNVPQTVGGVRVRDARVSLTISHGNVATFGTEAWGNVTLRPTPNVSAEQALDAGFEYAGGRAFGDVLVDQPKLEIVPVAPQEFLQGEAFAGPIGQGYRHRLVWTFSFQRPPEGATWEPMVDAHTGEVIAFQDKNHYVTKSFKGGVYPLTNTGLCPNNATCGIMQADWPMPFANTGLAAPNNFTNSAGLYDYVSGTATTTLSGQFVRMVDNCGAISASTTTGDLNLGGTNGQHDCTTGTGGGAGNTAASRSGFYELNKLVEQAKGWLPSNTWLNSQLTSNMNINLTCNAFWNGSTVNFYRSGGGCGNTGEIAAVFDHEWGHGIDDNDSGGALSNSSEGYADIAAIYRLQASCVGHGFSVGAAGTCGLTADGTGPNRNEAQVGAAHCNTDCSGVRDSDWAKHADNTPDTALGFVCASCSASTGPCGRQVHCAAAPARQAAWDLVTRDLTAAPFNLDSQSAFLIGNKVFYQGSGNIGAWHACTCGSSASGCGTTNGYIAWLTADDDNGNINDGTPHMTAIFNAFNRHGIACATPTAVNSGCAGGPTTAPTLTTTPGNNSVSLSWGAVSGASRYWMLRSEGHAGCNFGKAKIAEVTGTTYTDNAVANGRLYSYNVVAQGTSAACYSQVSNCSQVTPNGTVTPDFSVACSPSNVSVTQGSSANTTCTVTSTGGFSSAVTLGCGTLPAGVSCAFAPVSVTPPANGSASSTLTFSASGTATTGTSSVAVNGTSGATTRSASVSLSVNAPGPVTIYFDNFETATGWTTNPNATDTATSGAWERGDPAATTSGGVTTQQGTTVSGVNDLVTARLAGASAGANDVDGGTTSIQSPLITLPSTGTLTLSFSFYFAHLNNSSNVDFFRVSIVSGATTTQVFQELGAATNDAATFATQSVSLSAFAGQSIRILIQAADAGGASLVEAAVDDVRITQS